MVCGQTVQSVPCYYDGYQLLLIRRERVSGFSPVITWEDSHYLEPGVAQHSECEQQQNHYEIKKYYVEKYSKGK